MTGREFAKLIQVRTLFQWVRSGFAGYTVGTATFTGLETGVLSGAGATMNFVFAGIAFEAGVGIGSAINAGVDMLFDIDGCERLECE